MYTGDAADPPNTSDNEDALDNVDIGGALGALATTGSLVTMKMLDTIEGPDTLGSPDREPRQCRQGSLQTVQTVEAARKEQTQWTPRRR